MTVVEATGGAEGVRKAQDEGPDVILLDMTMPSMDGLRRYRRSGWNPRPP